MPEEKGPQFGGLLPASLMHFYSGKPMHFCSGVDKRPDDAEHPDDDLTIFISYFA